MYVKINQDILDEDRSSSLKEKKEGGRWHFLNFKMKSTTFKAFVK